MPGKPGINVAYLRRMLRMLSCERLFIDEVAVATGERRFGLAPLGKYFVEDAEGGSFAHLMTWAQQPFSMRAWDHLHEPVPDDTLSAFARANGGLSMWEFGVRHPNLNTTFNKAMGSCLTLYMRAVLDAYGGFSEVKVLVDVGGGSGNSLSLITARHRQVLGINFDMPHVVAAGLDIPGVEHVGGDFRESVPEGGDAILLQRILHDWNNATCVEILKNCCKALPAHGKVIVIDTMVPEGSDFAAGDSMAFKVDVVMMRSFGSDARERTKASFRSWLPTQDSNDSLSPAKWTTSLFPSYARLS